MKVAGGAGRLLRAVVMGTLLAPFVMAGTVPADVYMPETAIIRSVEAKAPAFEVEVVPLERTDCRLHLMRTKKRAPFQRRISCSFTGSRIRPMSST